MDKTLDLHGLKHEYVYKTVDQFIGNHIIKNSSEISIITGRSIKMKKIVSEILLDYGTGWSSEDLTIYCPSNGEHTSTLIIY